MNPIRTTLLAALPLMVLAQAAVALEIPLVVEERAGINRQDNHVNAGFPLPRGAVSDVSRLSLVRKADVFSIDGQDSPVPATFVVREVWRPDGSARWVSVHFTASMMGSSRVVFTVRDQPAAGSAGPRLTASAAGGRATVDTGVIRFTVNKSNFNLIEQLWFDPTGQGKYKAPAVAAGAARIKANLQVGKYRVVDKKASLDVIGNAVDATVKASAVELEESSPQRAVVKVTGQFVDGITPLLDFVARIHAMAGSGTIRVRFTVINTSGKQWQDFVGINELAFDVPASLEGPLAWRLSQSAGEDARGDLPADGSATLLQPYSEHYRLGGLADGGGRAKSLQTRRLGWASVAGKNGALTAAIRYFWQTHPKGLAVSGDGTVSVQLIPRQAEKAAVPEGVFSEAHARIDLFTGGARTQEFAVTMHPPEDDARAIAMGTIDPLRAVAPTSWYCQQTQAEGLLVDANIDNFKPEYRATVEAFNRRVDAVLHDVSLRREGSHQGIEEYGLLTFGAGVEHGSYVSRNDFLNTRFDGNYYDFPRAVLVNFWRAGKLDDFETAEAAALHLADIEIAHVNPIDPKLAGIERTCPNRGHFRQWWSAGGEAFGVSGNMDSTKCQSLYDMYHMTGDRWYLDCALRVSEYCMNHSGRALRAIGNRAKGLMEAYEQTGEQKYLDQDADWLDRMLVPLPANRVWDQNWMYGLAAEGLADLYRTTGQEKWARAAVTCCDSLINKYWKDDAAGAAPLGGFTANCFGYAYEFTGDESYLNRGLVHLRLTSTEYAGRTKTFAQQFRLSPYFLVYLTKDYKPPQPVVKR